LRLVRLRSWRGLCDANEEGTAAADA
jgi:hypothetical protein